MAEVKIEKEEKVNTSPLYGSQFVDRMNTSADALDKVNVQRPAEYSGQYQTQMDAAMDKVLNRPKFQYDVNEDALYQQYKDRYSQMGKTAMQDTIGQAAALTGGYGSTYGQRVGQQTYDQYMQGLTDKIPELYQLAMDKYNQDYAYDKDRLSVLDAADSRDYSRWGDSVNQWNADRSFASDQYNTAASMAMAAGDSLYNRLTALISLGYTPTDDELRAAGLNGQQVLAMQGKLRGGGGSSGGGVGYGGGSSSSGSGVTYNPIRDGLGPMSEDAIAKEIVDGKITATQSGNNIILSKNPSPAAPISSSITGFQSGAYKNAVSSLIKKK